MSADITTARLIGAGKKELRQRDDYYATPPVCTHALFKAERHFINRDGMAWDPACGEGHICEVAQDYMRHGAVGTDLIDRGYALCERDFFRFALLPQSDDRRVLIITNPPFKHAADFVRHAIKLGSPYIAMLLKLQFLEGVNRADLIEDCWEQHRYSLMRVHVFKNRVALWKNGKPHKGGMLALGWFIWQPVRQDQPHIHRIEVR